MAEPILIIENLQAGYGDVQILWGISLGVEAGQLTTIIGANGAGKTTTLRASMGIINPKAGRILFKGEDVTRLPPHAKAERGMVLVPEGRQLFANMTAEENLEMGAYRLGVQANIRKKLDHVYGLFPRLKERRTQKAGTLSGGEQQLLALARGLMAEPEVLIIDEMSLGLSPLLVQQMFLTLRDLRRKGITLLLVEQSVHLALALCDYAYVVAEGRVFLEGRAREVGQNEGVRTAYLGMKQFPLGASAGPQ